MLPWLPRPCELCRAWSGAALCPDCLARFAQPVPRCPRCALPSPQGQACGPCLRAPPSYARAIAAVDYAFPWDRLIVAFKFHHRPELATVLADRMHDAIEADGAGAVDLVLPVPLGPQRLAERGYNQAWELARRLAARRRLPADAVLLQRLRDTPHQIGLTRPQREHNLRDAMWVEPAHKPHLRERRIALVDDVLTTGVTADAAARVLLAAGAASVQLWVLARTPAPDAP